MVTIEYYGFKNDPSFRKRFDMTYEEAEDFCQKFNSGYPPSPIKVRVVHE